MKHKKNEKNTIWIPADKKEMVKNICAMRTGGNSSPEAIYENLKIFLNDLIKAPFLREENIKDSKMLNELKLTYKAYLKSLGSPASIKNAFSDVGVSRAQFAVLPDIIDLYIERLKFYLRSKEIIQAANSRVSGYVDEFHFSPEVEAMIADMVGTQCSYENCYALTKAAKPEPFSKLVILGRACMIYGPSEKALRYDPKVSINFYEVDNGIWLCSKHADLVNGKGGDKYSPETLLKWRWLHRLMIYERVTGVKSVTSMGFHFETNSKDAAADFLQLVADLPFLFVAAHEKCTEDFEENLVAFSESIDEVLINLTLPIFLLREVNGIAFVCKAISTFISDPERVPFLEDAWLVAKKVIGLSLFSITEKYKISLPAKLQMFAPISTKEK